MLKKPVHLTECSFHGRLFLSALLVSIAAVNAYAVSEPLSVAHEQDLTIPAASDYTTVKLLPTVTTERRMREQNPAEGALAPSVHLTDWSRPAPKKPEPLLWGRFKKRPIELRTDPLIYQPENLALDELADTRITAESFVKSADRHTLNECLERAAANYFPLQIAYDRQDLSKKKVRAALRELFPDLEFEYENIKGSSDGTGTYKGKSWRINARQPIFHGTQIWNRLREEKETLKSSLKEYDEMLNNLAFDVSKAYVELSRAEQIERERSSALEDAGVWRKISTQKGDSALISEIERLNVESIYHDQAAQFEIAKQDVELARLELQHLLGLEVIDDIAVEPLYRTEDLLRNEPFLETLAASEAIDGREHDKTLDEYIQLAYLNRPELGLNAHKVKANQYAELAARGGFMPNVDLIAEVGQLVEISTHLDSSKFRDFDNEKEYRLGFEMDWNAAGNTVSYDQTKTKNAPNVTSFRGGGEGSSRSEQTFSVAILDNLDQFAEVKEAVIEKKESIMELKDAEKKVIEDVKRAYYDYQKSRVELVSIIRRLDHRERVSKLSEVRLEKNEIEISEFLQSRVDLAADRIQFHRSMADFFLAKASVNRASGVRDLTRVEDIYGG